MVADLAAELETKMAIPWWSSQRCATSLRCKVSRCRRCRGSSWPMQRLVAVEVATAVVAGENMALRSMPTLGLATEALLNRLAHCRGFGLAEARSEIMRRRTNMQSSSPRLQKTKEVDVCGLKRCGRFRGGRRSSRGHESPEGHASSRSRLSALVIRFFSLNGGEPATAGAAAHQAAHMHAHKLSLSYLSHVHALYQLSLSLLPLLPL